MTKKKAVYQDKPRFDMSLKYEAEMKMIYRGCVTNMVKMLGIKMLSMNESTDVK